MHPTPSLRTEQALCQVPLNPQSPRTGGWLPGGHREGLWFGNYRGLWLQQRKPAQPQEGALLEDSRCLQWNSRAGVVHQLSEQAEPELGHLEVTCPVSCSLLSFQSDTEQMSTLDRFRVTVSGSQTQTLSSGSYRPARKIDITRGNKLVKHDQRVRCQEGTKQLASMETSRQSLLGTERGRRSLWGSKCKWMRKKQVYEGRGEEHSGRESVNAKAWRQERPHTFEKIQEVGWREGWGRSQGSCWQGQVQSQVPEEGVSA